jgi:hypothetical protein
LSILFVIESKTAKFKNETTLQWLRIKTKSLNSLHFEDNEKQ